MIAEFNSGVLKRNEMPTRHTTRRPIPLAVERPAAPESTGLCKAEMIKLLTDCHAYLFSFLHRNAAGVPLPDEMRPAIERVVFRLTVAQRQLVERRESSDASLS
jgi:hypothetical protein